MKRFMYLRIVITIFLLLVFFVIDSLTMISHDTLLAAGAFQEDSIRSTRSDSMYQEIEKALQSGSEDALTKHFASKVYLNLRGGNYGYFSANQAHYIMKEFFIKHKFFNVRFSVPGADADELYITGIASLLARGKTEQVKVYIGFIREHNSYRISQLTIF